MKTLIKLVLVIMMVTGFVSVVKAMGTTQASLKVMVR